MGGLTSSFYYFEVLVKKIIHYKRIVVRRIELAYIRRVKYKMKRKALNFFMNRALAATFHRWLEQMQAAKHSRGKDQTIYIYFLV